MTTSPTCYLKRWPLACLGVAQRGACWSIFIIGTVATIAHGNDTLLGKQPWREHSHGLSLRPPLGSRMIQQTADDALVRFYGQDGYTIRVYIRTSAIDMTVADLLPTAIHQLAGAYPSATVLEEKPIAPAGKPGALIYFRIPDRKQGPWMMGQAFVQLSNRAFAMLQMEVDLNQFANVRNIFEAVIDSLQVQNPKQLDQQRQNQVAQGNTWHQTVGPKRLAQSIRPEQWLRIVDHGVDTGYICIRQRADTQMGQDGIRVEIRSKMNLGDASYNSISHFFMSENGDYEFWSIRTTVRAPHAKPSPGNRPNPSETQSWAETGVRDKDKITVSRENPSGIQKHHWQRPPEGYLSQVQLHMLEQQMGYQNTNEMGFYTYHPNAQKIVYRTTRVEPNQDGSYVIYTRPSPDQEEQASYYSAKGDLEKRVLPGERLMIPATRAQLKMKWKVR